MLVSLFQEAFLAGMTVYKEGTGIILNDMLVRFDGINVLIVCEGHEIMFPNDLEIITVMRSFVPPSPRQVLDLLLEFQNA